MSIQIPVARGLLRQLSGFRGYPKREGEARFAEVLAESALSVEHAMAIVNAFDYEFPTLREIRDVALNLRPRFEPKVDQTAEWEKKYGKPRPDWSKNLTGSYEQQRAKMLWQSIRDSVYYTEGPGSGRPSGFWMQAFEFNRSRHPQELAAFREELKQRGWSDVMQEDWANEVQPIPVEPTPKRITQADIDRAVEERQRKLLAGPAAAEPKAEGSEDPNRWE